MKTIILDTNFLMIPTESKVDIFEEFKRIMSEEYSLMIMDRTRAELLNLSGTGKTRQKLAAKIGLQLLDKYGIQEIPTRTQEHVDKQILKYISQNTDCIVATQDSMLKKALKIKQIPVIVLRKHQYLEIIP